MSEEKLINTINLLLIFAGAFLLEGIMCIEPHMDFIKEKHIKEEQIDVIEVVEEERWLATYNYALSKEAELRNEWMHITVYYTTLDKWYAGRHYITAYCPWECGYNGENYPAGWRTSSGEICHYSDDPLVPTTCAIDRRYHAYGEYLMIDGKLYVTEDTGPGVQGLWVDIFVESMDEVQSFGSHYTDVYYVDFVEHGYNERYMHRLFVPSHTMVREINSLYNED